MKQKFLLMLMLCCSFIWNAAYATETEPNNTKAQANNLALNGSNSGTLNPSTDIDWWKVTTTSDGNLNVTLTASNGLFTWFDVYDNDGTTLLGHENTNGTFTYTVAGLAAGTYYIKIYPYFSGQMPTYTISNALVLPAQANDVEPNDTKALALSLPLNSSLTGHVDYYYNNHRDSVDWYKVKTTGDGRLRLRLTSGNGQYIWAYLYDNNGTILLTSDNTNGTVDINKDGLAAGTYYVAIKPYYNTGYIPYTLADSLFRPSEINDVEPNDTKAQALVLPLNGSVTGHTDYYYDNHRDSADWYKVTTNGDGRLRLRITSGNGQYVWAYLYDNNGSTLLTSDNTNGTVDINKDGLAAGTYYVRVNAYYNTGFIPYTLADSLFRPSQVNDAEPDSTRALALTLPVNSTTTGHINYYYNNHRDSADWYKITTTVDGRLRLRIASANGQYIWAYLFDNNGTTQLAADNTNSTVDISKDGLAAGTYYVRVNSYYNTGFAPYTLSDSLFTYSYANDGKVNEKPYQAATLNSNLVTPGHVGFYYNNRRDSVDWWKINYTGTSGALTVTLNLEAEQCCGIAYTWMYIYKDTLSAPIYANNTNGPSLVANLTSLTQQYYWVKIIPYYNTQFTAYSLTPTFTQVTKAKITVVSIDTSDACDSTNSITLKCTKSSRPYTVQLYRFNQPYGAPKTVNNTNAFTFSNLPHGLYYARAYGDGATGNAYGKTVNIELIPAPTTPTTTSIHSTQAKFNWTSVSCASYYVVQYHKAGDSAWINKNTVFGNVAFITIKDLTPSTTYRWRVASADSANGFTGLSAYTDSVSFTTTASFAATQSGEESSISKTNIGGGKGLLLYPNPATSSFSIQYSAAKADTKLNATLKDVNGKILWSLSNTVASALTSTKVDVSKLPNGIYLLQVTDLSNNTVITKKVVVSR